VLSLLSGLLVLSLGVAVSAGTVSIPLDQVWQIAANRLRPGSYEPTWSAGRESIVWDLRFPRALLGVLVGAGLAATGAVLQAATRTPLADPFLFGMSAGAALGAVAVITHLGDFAGASTLPAAVVGAALVWFRFQAPRLNALLLGDETAVALGIPVGRLRLMLFAASALVTAVLVALSGAIGFVGLIIPHILRRLVGGDNRRVIPLSAMAGALFLVWTDLFARTLLAPQELPIGILTAAVGGTYFAWSLTRR